TASGSGGTSAYSYLWSNSATTASVTGVVAGTYTVTITDANGCTASANNTVTEPASLSAVAGVDSNVTCNGLSDGGLTASASGGTSAYSYLWSNSATTASVTGVTAGTYTVTITDAHGCTTSANNTVTEPASLSAVASVDSNVTCNGLSDGGLTASASGGTSTYNYLWSNSATTASVTGVSAGTYTVTITDANGCTDTASGSVTEPAVLSASVDTNVVSSFGWMGYRGGKVSCNGFSDGGLVASATGGTTAYNYTWSNSATTAGIVGVSAGTYTVTITDANGCTASANNTVTEPATLTVGISLDSDESCPGSADGQLTASGSGGTTAYKYIWSTSDKTASASGLSTGTYTVTITDAFGCTSSNSKTVGLSGTRDINLKGNSTSIASGDNSPSTSDDTYLGRVNIDSTLKATFTIENLGNCDLTLSGSPYVSITGTHASDFKITQQPSSATIGSSGSLSFEVTFSPSATGARNATIEIASNDPDESNYTFAIRGSAYRIDENDSTMICLDGSDDYVEINDEAPFDLETDFTIETWFKVNGNWSSTNQAIISKGSNWNITRDGTNRGLRFSVAGLSGNTSVAGTTKVDDSLWHHVAAIYDGSKLKLYIDGNLDAEVNASGNATTNNDYLQIGALGGSNNFNGDIEETRIWSSVRSVKQLQQKMNVAGDLRFNSLIAYYQYNGTSSTVLDNSSGYSGTLKNGLGRCSSLAPTGKASVYTLIFNSAGRKSAPGTGIEIQVNSLGGTIAFVLNRMTGTANGTKPSSATTNCEQQYWIVRPYVISGGSSYDVDICFDMGGCLVSGLDSLNPSNYKMYKRNESSDGSWNNFASATSASPWNEQVCFKGITSFSQIIIGTLGGTFLGPEIQVTQGGNNINTGDKYTFANTNVGQSTDVTFDITNLGISTLNITTPISISGSDYSVVSQPSNNIPGNSSSFVIRFTPSALGTRTGSVSISNNDSNEDPFVIDFSGLGIRPVVTNVTASNTNGTYIIGDTIHVETTFSQNVTVSGTPEIILETGSVDHRASYTSGSGSSKLVFDYIVKEGDVTTDLEYWSTTALRLMGGSIKNGVTDADTTLPALGTNSLGANKNLVIDGIRPKIISVNSTNSDGYYRDSDVIAVIVRWDDNVYVSGTPQLNMENGGSGTLADYGSGSNSKYLTFYYTVGSSDENSDLDYKSSTALSLNSGSIKDVNGNTAALSLPVPGASGSLSSNRNIVIDNTAPTVVSVTSPNSDGSYKAGSTIDVTINFDEKVYVTGTPQILLETGTTDREASYLSGSGSNKWTFRYVVQSGDKSADLDYASTSALKLHGGYIKDEAGNRANLALATPGNANSLGNAKDIIIDTDAPSAPSIASITDDTGLSNSDGITYDQKLVFKGTAEANSTVFVYRDGAAVGSTSASSTGAWTFNYTNATLSEGRYIFTAKAEDAAGNLSSNSTGFAVVVDITKPNKPIAADLLASSDSGYDDSDNKTNDNTPSFEGKAEAGSKVEIYAGANLLGSAFANAGSWSFTVPGASALADGNYTITVTATDTAGNTSDASNGLDIIIDTQAPSAPSTPDLLASSDSGSSDTDNETNDNTPTFEGTAEANSWVEVFAGSTSLGKTAADATGKWSFTLAAANKLSDGTYNITATATDTAGNTGSASSALSIVIDTQKPSTPSTPDLLASSDSGISDTDNRTNDNTPSFEGTAEANSVVEIFEGSNSLGITTANGSGNWSFTVAGTQALADGTYSISASSTDLAGNSSSGNSLSIIIDTQSPSAPAIAAITNDNGASSTDGITNDQTLMLSGTSAAYARIKLYNSGSALSTTDANSSGQWQYDYSTTTLAAGSYTFTATAMDSAGNVSSASSDFDVVVDTTAPSPISVSSTTANGTYSQGDSIFVTVTFSEVVVVSGSPKLQLETGTNDAWAVYSGGSNSKVLTFKYTVAAQNISSDLEYLSKTALTLNGGSIMDIAGNDADTTLPKPGNGNSLADNKNLVINAQPTIAAMSDLEWCQGHDGNQQFSIGDIDNSVSTLVVTATSSNTALVKNGAISISGTGSTKTIALKSVYGMYGQTVITVKVTDANNSSDSAQFTVDVQPRPVAAYAADTVCQENYSMFTDKTSIGSGKVVAWTYTFNDGGSSTSQNPKHLYTNAGTYNTELIVTSDKGCKDTSTFSAIVYPKPVSNYSYGIACEDKQVQFTDSSEVLTGKIAHYFWDFGDVSTSNQQNPNNVYKDTGSYNALLVVTTDMGCKDSMTKMVHVSPVPVAKFSVSNVCSSDSAMFMNASTIAAGSLMNQWSFGDSTTSMRKSPGHKYQFSGYYSVKLSITSNAGCKDSVTKSVEVYALPTVDFSAANVCDMETMSFANNTKGANKYNWDFGDGKTSSVAIPDHIYKAAGSYTVKLLATSVHGCKDSLSKTQAVYAKPMVSFNAADVCFTDSTLFKNSTTNAVAYNWSFGDGTSASIETPHHLYSKDGTYMVTLVATSDKGCKDTTSNSVVVNPLPQVAFTNNDTCDRKAVVMNNMTKGASSYKWFFGDGNTSTATSPKQTYGRDGKYTITLVASTSLGCVDSAKGTAEIFPNPIANFTQSNVCYGVAMDFVNKSSITKGINHYKWTFGDGGKSLNTTPSYLYSKDGSYTVRLVATSDKGCQDSMDKSVTVYPQPVADFASMNECDGKALSFTNNSKNATSYDWIFGDGNSSTGSNPSHLYKTDGMYQVTLRAKTIHCADSVTKAYTVYKKPMASFANDSVCDGSMVSYTNTSHYGPINAYHWSFGDGDTSTMQSPKHQYAAFGTYTTTLMVITEEGCRDTAQASATVYPMPVTAFNTTNVCLYDSLKLTNNSSVATGKIVSNSWEYGDGMMSTTKNTSRKFERAGTYKVMLTTTTDKGCSTNSTQTFDIYSVPMAAFAADSNCFGFTTPFYNHSTVDVDNLSKYYWQFGDGSLSNDMNPVHYYKTDGLYEVQLVAESDKGCKDTVSNMLRIYVKPVADFNAAAVCYGVATEFNNATTNGKTYNWDFADGSGSSSLENPKYTYMNPGTYPVVLFAESEHGCRDTVSKAVTVYELPVANFTVNNHCLGTNFMPEDKSLGSINDWSWRFGDGGISGLQAPSHVYAKDGNYIVNLTVTNADGCLDSTKREVTVWPLPEMDVRPDTVVSRGYTVRLWATGGVRYEWQSAVGLDNPNIRRPVATVTDDITYTVTIYTEHGCSNDTTVTLRSRNDYTLEPSNIITPDGNGKNDYWLVEKAQYYNDVEVIIFDRWGRVVYTSKAYDNKWNATSNGKELPDGVYYYIIKVPVERSEYKGSITVFR
ncbi:PKD domain-containing protein, partial [bacterium]|nr:PKD domain-containing protein [bacterium]